MVTMAQSATNWRNAWIVNIHSHMYIYTVTTTLCEAPARLLQNLEPIFSFEGMWGRGIKKPEYPEKNPDSLPANRYHTLEEKIQRPGRQSGIKPSPSIIGDKLAWPGARVRVWPTELQTAPVAAAYMNQIMQIML